ncbi:trichohyalin-like isoform X2 [Sander lucioperca]|uniref:trichohyalin-like isoform X2 n=1 Tax=Sander lucioperca TaxID=283035 RepID=UPI001653C8BA|nr:trichohyalin-like isoform X2 [Sander lucioperca]
MAGVPNSLTRTQSDSIAEVVSAESYHAVLDTSPPDYVEKISRYLEASVGQSKQDKVSNGPAEAESDSGDSLFLTQKSVPEAVRSRRRCHYSLRSTPISPRDLEEELSRSEDSLSSSSHEESKTDKERRRKKYTVPKYHFPFLAKRKCKLRSTLLAVQNTSLHHYVMGGFFNCVRELWQGYQREHLESSLPAVDMDGQDLSPLSEEDEERSEDEDMKVVERKHFVAPSKAKRQQTWCKQLKQQRRRDASNARQETSRRRQTKVIPMSSDTETPDHGESSCRVRGQRERNDEHATSDGNFTAQNKTPKTKRRLPRENKASEEELCSDSDAAVCEPRKPQRRHPAQKGREASTTVTEPQTDASHVEDLFQAGQARDGPGSPNLPHSLSGLISDTNNDRICNETKVKKRKKKKKGHHEGVDEGKSQSREEPEGLHAATSVNKEVEETPSLSEDNRAESPAAQTSEPLELNENNGMENESRDDKIQRQEERDVPDSKRKRTKRKENKSSADVRQEVDGNLEADVRAEDSVFSVSCNMEDGGKEKKKKKKKRRSGEDVEHLQSCAVAEPLNNDAEKRKKKKKKRKKREGLVITEQCEEEEEASNRTLDSPPMSAQQLEETENCLENAAASQETSESKRKKHEKKQQSSSNDATQDGEEGVDVSFCIDDSVTLAKGSGTSLKKKKKTIFEGLHISYAPEENKKNGNNTQKTKEGLDDQNAEMVTKEKKKKKIGKILSRTMSEETVAQSDDSVSMQEKEKDKKRTSSFLVADAEENDALAHGERNPRVWGAENPVVSAGALEQLNDGVTKKKRKMSVEQHSVDFEDPNKTCQGSLLELTDTGLESTADVGLSPTEGAVVSKKKKKKKKCKDEPCHLIREGPLTATEDAESVRYTLNSCRPVSHKKKGKHGRSAETPHDSSTCDQATNLVERASASPETLGNQALNDMADKKKKKKTKSTDNVLLEGKSLTESAELEPRQNKKKERNKQSTVPSVIPSSPIISETSLSKLEMSSSDNIMKNKQRKVKRRLLNPSEDFLTDC